MPSRYLEGDDVFVGSLLATAGLLVGIKLTRTRASGLFGFKGC
jgi:hypothetical protein